MFDRLRQKVAPPQGPGLLIVDDDEKVRAFVRALLGGEGFGPVWEAPEGESAIKISFEHHPRLVILDYQMPGMNGEAVTRSLRLISPGSRIILLTAVLRERPDWADAYLQKSEIDRLPEVVQDQLTRLVIS